MSDEMVGLLGGLTMILILFLVMAAVFIIPYWRIFQRTGQAGALSLLMLLPLVNLIMLYVLAFGSWPIEEELTRHRRREQNR